MHKLAGNNFAGIKLLQYDNVIAIAAMTNTENFSKKRSQSNPLQLFSRIFLHHQL